MNCPNCHSNAYEFIGEKVSFYEASMNYICHDCCAEFTVNGKVSIKWDAPITTKVPAMTIEDVLRRLKRDALKRQDIPPLLLDTMRERGLVRVVRNQVLLKGKQNCSRKKKTIVYSG